MKIYLNSKNQMTIKIYKKFEFSVFIIVFKINNNTLLNSYSKQM
jgi:hypothetical protein